MPAGTVPSGRGLAELALQLGRIAYGDCTAAGLTAAQWTALRYFARANRFSRTVSAFAEFHATTRGTASQTVKSLVSRGYLRRSPSERDGRSTRFDLTATSLRLLEQDPLQAVVRAAESLSPAQQSRTASGLNTLLHQLAIERRRPLPGRCGQCSHLGRGEREGAHRCRLMNESLATDELAEICIRFLPRA